MNIGDVVRKVIVRSDNDVFKVDTVGVVMDIWRDKMHEADDIEVKAIGYEHAMWSQANMWEIVE